MLCPPLWFLHQPLYILLIAFISCPIVFLALLSVPLCPPAKLVLPGRQSSACRAIYVSCAQSPTWRSAQKKKNLKKYIFFFISDILKLKKKKKFFFILSQPFYVCTVLLLSGIFCMPVSLPTRFLMIASC